MENEQNIVEPIESQLSDIVKVEVTFRGSRRMLYSAHKGASFQIGDIVIAEIEKGADIGRITLLGQLAALKKSEPHPHNIIRHANEEDLAKYEAIRNDESEAFLVGKVKIKEHNLDMSLTEVEKQFDESKMMFYFLAEHRVDFRELVKELAAHFRTRIELRQIGVRDEARRYDGVGVCGRRLCCAGWLNIFDQISTQMARVQHLSLNQAKLSGNCGRLKCCLKYEMALYEEVNSCMPHHGDKIVTAKGEGRIVGVSSLKGQVKVAYSDSPISEIVDIDKCQQLLFPERFLPPEPVVAVEIKQKIAEEPINEDLSEEGDLLAGSANEESELFNDNETEE